MIRKCVVCGKEFENKTNKKFCSDECRRNEYNRKCRENYHVSVSRKKIKHCAVCGKAFRGKNHKYCSIECRDKEKKLNKLRRLKSEDGLISTLILNNPNCEYGNVDCDFCLELKNCLSLNGRKGIEVER